MAKLTQQELESHLWKSADILRGSIDSSDYESYIFGLLFIKRLSDVFHERCSELIAEHGEEIGGILAEDSNQYQFFVPLEARWGEIRRHAQDIGTVINVAFESLENENQTLEGVLTPIDFNRKEVLTDEVLQRLLQHFSTIELTNNNLPEPDMLGRAYEYLIAQFADDAGKKGGKPSKVVELIVKLIKPEEGMRVYDPTCGSGGMLIQSVDNIRTRGGNPQSFSLYGQEKNLNIWNIAKMNLLLHGLSDHNIRIGDAIRDPILIEDNELMLFDRVITNPPFSLKEWGRDAAERDSSGRFRFGIPPKNAGDFAFVQHIIASLKPKGMAGVVMPHGVLFRSGAEATIRKGILEADLIDAVIGLPAGLFYGTGIPVCILILKRNKPEERKDKVLFIAADDDFQKGKNQNTLRETDVKKIVEAFNCYKDIEKYARVVELEEIKHNDYNLSITRYIDKSEEEEQVDLRKVIGEISELERKKRDINTKLSAYLAELGLGEV